MIMKHVRPKLLPAERRGPMYHGPILCAIRQRMADWNLKPAHVASQLRQFNHAVIYRFLSGENTRTEVAEAVLGLLRIKLEISACETPSWAAAHAKE